MKPPINQEQIVEALSKFKVVSKKKITCIKCNHIGFQGLVSANYFPMFIGGVVTFILGFFADKPHLIHWICWSTSPFLMIFGLLKKNKFQCPSCGLISTPGASSTSNPIYKK
jgi:hypothetical protein